MEYIYPDAWSGLLLGQDVTAGCPVPWRNRDTITSHGIWNLDLKCYNPMSNDVNCGRMGFLSAGGTLEFGYRGQNSGISCFDCTDIMFIPTLFWTDFELATFIRLLLKVELD